DEPTWEGLAKGVLVLGVLWWSWVGYSWLTSVVDPEEGAVRIAIFAAMAAMLVAALSVPEAFGDAGLIFAIAYGSVRIGHIALFMLASSHDEQLRRSVVGLAGSTAVSVGLLVGASFADGLTQGGLWTLALALDMAGPAFFGVAGWRLSAHHFTERHGLIMIIALGESIVAIGVGVEGIEELGPGIVTAAVVGTAIAAALWWLYFDVVALVAERRLAEAQPGREQNAMARDSYSFLHFPMVAGIVLVALGMKKTIGHVEDPLKLIPAVALYGGAATYLLAHVAFRYRHIHSINTRRLAMAVLLVALIAVGVEIPALASATIVAVVLIVLIVIETRSYGDSRARIRNELRAGG
ncbi:MAG: low temperature requirement protein A, partial [Solirubrobacteraceae bacterium]